MKKRKPTEIKCFMKHTSWSEKIDSWGKGVRRWRHQREKTTENHEAPVELGYLMGLHWRVPNNEIVVVAVRHSDTKSAIKPS